MEKKLSIILALVLLAACAGIKWNDDAADVAIEIVARRLAYHVAKNNPDLAEPGILFCDALIKVSNGEDITTEVDRALDYLGESFKVDDPLFADDMASLMSLLKIEPGTIDIEMSDSIRTALRAVGDGFRRAKNGMQLPPAKI